MFAGSIVYFELGLSHCAGIFCINGCYSALAKAFLFLYLRGGLGVLEKHACFHVGCCLLVAPDVPRVERFSLQEILYGEEWVDLI